MRAASLFAGIDAVGIAVRALGGRTVAYSEYDPTPRDKKHPEYGPKTPDGEQYNQRLLAKHDPDAQALGDVTKVDWDSASKFDFASAGFPCQDLSAAGNGKGLDGARSGLYVEVIRMVRESHPRLVLVENVPRLLGLHFERLLRDLADERYDCEWDVISAAAAGGPHLRERLWLLAYPAGEGIAPRAFGRPLRRSKLDPWTSDGAKWHRAGMMCQGVVFESDPVAPRKTKRVDGRTYWVGVNLFQSRHEQALIPSPRSTDGDRGGRGDLIQAVRGNSNGHFAQRIWDGQIIPSPVARDWKGQGMKGQLGTVAAQGLWPTVHGMPKDAVDHPQGPSGNELGRAVNQGLWPTPKADARGSRVDSFESYESGRHGITLAVAVDGEARGLLPTPTRADGEHRSEQGPRHYADGSDNPTLLGAARLLPTPAATSYGSNQGGAAGRVGEKRHSLESMARLGLIDDDSTQSGLSEPRSLPASTSVSATSSDSLRPCEPINTDGDLLVPRFSFQEAREDGHSGSLWPTPSRADGTGGPGTSPKRAGGENLRTKVASEERGSLNPDWVEWMMALPVGWTDIDCDEPVYRPFWDEPSPRVIAVCPNRRQRLSAIGNSLVWLIPYWILLTYRDRVGSLPGDVGRPRLSAFE